MMSFPMLLRSSRPLVNYLRTMLEAALMLSRSLLLMGLMVAAIALLMLAWLIGATETLEYRLRRRLSRWRSRRRLRASRAVGLMRLREKAQQTQSSTD